MSTQIRDTGDMVAISSVTAGGKRRRLARRSVLVPAGDKDAIRAEIIRQATQARFDVGLDADGRRLVV